MRILAIRIPKVLTHALGLRHNSEVELHAQKGRLLFATAPSYTLDELLAAMNSSNLHPETNWGCPVGKEDW
jgi:antitoxin component of MazEF toxin-antitoxin module